MIKQSQIKLLAQLIEAMNDAVEKMERAKGKKVEYGKTKEELLRLQKQVDKILK